MRTTRIGLLLIALAMLAGCSSERNKTMANEIWSSDADYSAGSDPWSGTPTKAAPSLPEIAAGHTPGVPVPAEVENWWKNRSDTRVLRAEAQLASLGRIHTIHRDWGLNAEGVDLTEVGAGGTATAVINPGPRMQGWGLWLVTNASADWARGRISPVMTPPQLASYAQVLEWDVDITEMIGANVDLYMGLMDLGAYDNSKGSVSIYKSAASGNWQILHHASAPGPVTTADTGVAATAGVHRMRIEWVGSDYAGGPYAKFYVDDVLIHTAVADLPNNAFESMYVTFDLLQTGATGANVWISPFTWRQARTVTDGNTILIL
jgi:hypothetical protein